jgi:pimeloyl-ACP methyl ester carboxylesterase
MALAAQKVPHEVPVGPEPARRVRSITNAVRAAVLAVAAFSGVTAAGLYPRGPVTGTQVALSMSSALLIGGAAGWLLRSRWALLIAPALHLAGFEIARATVFRLDGPSFGRPRFDVTMGVLLFFATHVMYALVVTGPMTLGVIAGLAAAHYRRYRRGGAIARGAIAVVLTGLVTLFAVQLLSPGRVEPAPGGVSTLAKVRLGGVDQWVSIRGSSATNPVLLHLSGGPGSSDVGWVRTFNRDLEDHFTVAVWEQRGVGKSYPALDPANTLTLDRMVSDGLDLARWLAYRFGQTKVYLTGNSWGSTLGVLMVQREPSLFWAYAGTGQMVSQRETDRVLYHQLLDYADRTGDAGLRDRLRAYGEPPYRDVLAYAFVMQYYDLIEPYQHNPEFEHARGTSGFFPGEYSLLDTWNEVRGFADMGGLLYPALQGLDFRVSVPALGVPVYFMQGRHELTARSRFADVWIATLRAPIKRVYIFENSGHNADAEEPARYNDLMINTVLAETYRPG